MPLTPFLVGLYGFAVLAAIVAIGHAAGARRHWRQRRRFAACHRGLWSLVFVLLALLGAIGGTALLGYRRLAAETPIASIETRALAPDGSRSRSRCPTARAGRPRSPATSGCSTRA